jgi:hypothetical protein
MASPSAAPSSSWPFFSPIRTLHDARAAIREARYSFYVCAAIQGVVAILGQSFGPLSDVPIYLLLGYLIGRTKSRAVGVVMVVFTAMVLAVTVAQKVGLYRGSGGSNIILAVIVLYTALRATYATAKYHSIVKTRINVRAMATLGGISVVLNIVVLVACLYGLIQLGYDLEDEANDTVIGLAVLPAMVAVTVLVFLRWLPFTGRLSVVASQETSVPEGGGASRQGTPQPTR